MEVEVKPRFVQQPEEVGPVPGPSSAPVQVAPKEDSFWDSIYKYKSVIFISVVLTILICCVIYYFWNDIRRPMQQVPETSPQAAYNGHGPGPNITQQPTAEQYTAQQQPAAQSQQQYVQPQYAAQPQQQYTQQYAAQSQQQYTPQPHTVQQYMMPQPQAYVARPEASQGFMAPRVVATPIISISLDEIINKTDANINDESRVTEVTDEVESEPKLEPKLEPKSEPKSEPKPEVVPPQTTSGAPDDILSAVIQDEPDPAETSCVFEFKNGKKCGKATNGKKFCSRHLQ